MSITVLVQKNRATYVPWFDFGRPDLPSRERYLRMFWEGEPTSWELFWAPKKFPRSWFLFQNYPKYPQQETVVPDPGPLVVPKFGTMSRIRDIWLKCPYFVPICQYFGPKIGTLVIYKHISTIFVPIFLSPNLSLFCPDFSNFCNLIRSQLCQIRWWQLNVSPIVPLWPWNRPYFVLILP